MGAFKKTEYNLIKVFRIPNYTVLVHFCQREKTIL